LPAGAIVSQTSFLPLRRMPILPRGTANCGKGRLRLAVACWAGFACAAVWFVADRNKTVSGETSTAAAAVPDDSAGAFSKNIAPFVANTAGDCHSGATPEAKLDLTKYGDLASVVHDRKIWRKVFFKLEAGEMPPQDQTQPKPDERAAVTRWDRHRACPAGAVRRARPGPDDDPPGSIGPNTTTRSRDLMAIDFHPADDFPTDDVGEGFDNIGAILSLSPILMEKYLAAAEQCVDRALTILPESPPPIRSFRGSSLDVDGKLPKNPSRRCMAVERQFASLVDRT